MTDLALVTDHTEQALALLIDAYKGLPRMAALVTSITNRLQEFEDTNWDVQNKRLLDYTDRGGNPAHAVGAQLDTIGRLVGRGRAGQDDATYLVYIRAQIFLNRSTGLRSDVITLLQLVEAALFTYAEFYPCTVLIEFQTAPATSPTILLDLGKRVVDGGIQLFLTAPPPGIAATHTFAFSHDGTPSNPLRSFGHEGSALYGGVLASEYA